MMAGALFMPFATNECGLCRALFLPPPVDAISGYDGWLLVIAATLQALLAVVYLLRVRRATVSTLSMVLSMSVLGLSIFEGVNAGGRVLLWDTFMPQDVRTYTPPVALDAGFLVLLCGALISVTAAVAMMVASDHPDLHGRQTDRQNAEVSRVVGMLSAIASALMLAALFLPFAGFTSSDVTYLISVLAGPDGAVALLALVGFGVAAGFFDAGLRRRASSVAAALCAVVCVAVGVFDGDHAGSRVLGGGSPGGPVGLRAGFYLFIGGAVLGVLAAVVMAFVGRASTRTPRHAVLGGAPAVHGS